MKKVVFLLSLSLMVLVQLAAQSSAQTNNDRYSFTLEINGLKSPTSTVYVGFYTADNSFPKQGQHQFRKVIQPNGNVVSETWDDIPSGEYAIAIYQDLNEDNQLNTNLFGMPQEPYGFSTDFKAGMFNLPTFQKCKITIDKDAGVHKVSLAQ